MTDKTPEEVALALTRYTLVRRDELERLRGAVKAYLDWRDERLAQWEAVAKCGHEHGVDPCPEWDTLTSEPFDKDQELDDAMRQALAGLTEGSPE